MKTFDGKKVATQIFELKRMKDNGEIDSDRFKYANKILQAQIESFVTALKSLEHLFESDEFIEFKKEIEEAGIVGDYQNWINESIVFVEEIANQVGSN